MCKHWHLNPRMGLLMWCCKHFPISLLEMATWLPRVLGKVRQWGGGEERLVPSPKADPQEKCSSQWPKKKVRGQSLPLSTFSRHLGNGKWSSINDLKIVSVHWMLASKWRFEHKDCVESDVWWRFHGLLNDSCHY